MHSGLNSGTEWWTMWLIGGKSNASVGAKYWQLAILAMFLVSNFTCRTRYRPITTAGDLRCIHFFRKQCNFQQLHEICISRGNVQLQKHLNEIFSKSAQKRIETVDFWPIYSKSTLQCVRFGRRWSWCIYGLRSMIDARLASLSRCHRQRLVQLYSPASRRQRTVTYWLAIGVSTALRTVCRHVLSLCRRDMALLLLNTVHWIRPYTQYTIVHSSSLVFSSSRQRPTFRHYHNPSLVYTFSARSKRGFMLWSTSFMFFFNR